MANANTKTNSKPSDQRVRTFVDWFVRSDYVSNYQQSRIDSDYGIVGRFQRVHDAAESGADGSTHAEVIKDWREAFADWVSDRRRGMWSAEPDRFIAAVEARFDQVEQWHVRNGSINGQIG